MSITSLASTSAAAPITSAQLNQPASSVQQGRQLFSQLLLQQVDITHGQSAATDDASNVAATAAGSASSALTAVTNSASNPVATATASAGSALGSLLDISV